MTVSCRREAACAVCRGTRKPALCHSLGLGARRRASARQLSSRPLPPPSAQVDAGLVGVDTSSLAWRRGKISLHLDLQCPRPGEPGRGMKAGPTELPAPQLTEQLAEKLTRGSLWFDRLTNS